MISKFYVKLDVKDVLRINSALNRVLITAKEWITEKMPQQGALDYIRELRSAIVSQKYMGSYKPLNTEYVKWKGNNKHWVLEGDLMRSLSVFPSTTVLGGNGWMGGIPSNTMDTGGKSWFYPRDNNPGKPHNIAKYGRVGEFGGKKRSARPIFTPVMEVFEKDQWRKRGKLTLDYIGKQWR